MKNAKELSAEKIALYNAVYKGIAKDWHELRRTTPDLGAYAFRFLPWVRLRRRLREGLGFA